MTDKKKKWVLSENETNRRTRVGAFNFLPIVVTVLLTLILAVALLRGVTVADIPIFAVGVGAMEVAIFLILAHEMLMTICNEYSIGRKIGSVACFVLAVGIGIFALVTVNRFFTLNALMEEDQLKTLLIRFLIALLVQFVVFFAAYLFSRPWRREFEEKLAWKKEKEERDAQE